MDEFKSSCHSQFCWAFGYSLNWIMEKRLNFSKLSERSKDTREIYRRNKGTESIVFINIQS